MKKLPIFESANPEILKSFLNTDDYKQLTPLKQNMVYSYVMIETGQMTSDEIKNKFGVADGALKGWLKYSEDLFDDLLPKTPVYNMIGQRVYEDYNLLSNSFKEYVIWGCDKNHPEETLLLSSIQGKPITDIKDAENWENILKTKYDCYNTRIQTIDLKDNNINF